MRKGAIISSVIVLTLGILASLSLLVWPHIVSALGLTTPFGGRVLFTLTCTCNPNPTDRLIYVGPPAGGQFIHPVTARVYPYYNVNPPAWVLGLAAGESTCMVYVGETCVSVGVGPSIYMVGTSVY